MRPPLALVPDLPSVEMVAQLRAVIGRLSRGLRPGDAAAGLSPSQMSVLATVARRGPLGLNQLSRLENLHPTMLSRIAAKLVAAGLVTRVPDPDDGRAALLKISERGRALHRQIRAERDRVLVAGLRSLPPEQRRALRDALPALDLLASGLRRED
ncbi:MAG: MarR family winged helix-turn-helix transcriptional regulator [Candidatus Dormibacteria bacterium]